MPPELPLIEKLVAYKALDNETKLDTQTWYDPMIYLFISVMDPPNMTCLPKKMCPENFIVSLGKRSKLYLPPLKLANPILARFLISTRNYLTYYLCMP